MRKLKQQKGITLVALVITIIILLILVGISIVGLRENGLFGKAQIAKEKTENAQEIENNILLDYENVINDVTNNKTPDNENKVKGKYILFEVYDHIDGNSSSISEIKLYDKNENPISYNVIVNEAFDSNNNGLPTYWTEGRFWNYTNLYDGSVSHTNNSEGGENCTLFLYESNPNLNSFSRFIVDLGEASDIEDIKICIGDVSDRTPKSVSAYMINNYSSDTYANNVVQRNNDGLTLIKTINFSSIVSEPTWYSFMK